jgi:hypothetical protein
MRVSITSLSSDPTLHVHSSMQASAMQNTLISPSTVMQAIWQKVERRLRFLRAAVTLRLLRQELHPGQVFYSPGGTLKYRVIGACCRLYDREQLPYPCCRLSWHSKEPFWNRQGRRFVPDIAAKQSPSYCVGLVDYPETEPIVMTLSWLKLSSSQRV